MTRRYGARPSPRPCAPTARLDPLPLRSTGPIGGVRVHLPSNRLRRASMSTWTSLQALLDDLRVSELMINGPGTVWVERAGTIVATDVVVDDGDIELLVERLLAPSGRRVDRRTPYADARLPDGSRVNIVIPPAAV